MLVSAPLLTLLAIGPLTDGAHFDPARNEGDMAGQRLAVNLASNARAHGKTRRNEDDDVSLADADVARGRWWSLDAGLGGTVAVTDYGWTNGKGGSVSGTYLGPAVRVGLRRQRKGRLLYFGGGPVLTYAAWHLADADKPAHAFSLGAELFLGAGGRKWLFYGHGQAGLWLHSTVTRGPDTENSVERTITFHPRLAVGGGFQRHFGRRGRLSLGALVDYVVVSGVDLYATLGVHFR